LLRQQIPQPGFIHCYYSQGTTLLLEDIEQQGTKTVAKDFKNMAKGTDELTMDHARLAVRQIAQMHAAALGKNWFEFFPQIKTDVLCDTAVSKVSKSF
jgi:hypothetical protein